MSKDSILLMEDALDLAYQELDLLQKEETEEAATMAEQRRLLIERAWENRAKVQVEILQEQLMTMSKMQDILSETANFLSDKLRTEIKTVKQENARMSGYSFSLNKPNNPERLDRRS